jgi:hypothetical protein
MNLRGDQAKDFVDRLDEVRVYEIQMHPDFTYLFIISGA